MLEPIAIISMSCLFPGANSPEAFWQALKEGKDLTQDAGLGEMGFNPEVFLADKKGVEDHYYNLRGGFVRDFQFDPTGYKLHPKRLEALDDVCQWPMHVARKAIEQAGYWGNQKVLDRCGLILGNLSFPTKSSNRLCIPLYHQAQERALKVLLENPSVHIEPPPSTALENRRISGHPALISAEALGLGGVSYVLDAACASSLYTLALAAEYLNAGKVDMMLAGSVSAADPFFVNMGFSTFQAYPLGRDSKPLDKTSAGLVSGSGAGVFLLKRYADALKDGDDILATLEGYGLSNDGSGKSVLSPNPRGQKLAFERAYQNSKVTPSEIEYVECHATGTPLGDVTELSSMENFFKPKGAQFKIGSVKSNCGHLLTAAGMASMMKVVLAMQQGSIPETLHLSDPLSSPEGWFTGKQMVQGYTPWPETSKGTQIAGVNAFGFGGTNAHVILKRAEGKKPVGKKKPKTKMKALSITGMEAFFGTAQGLGEFQQRIYEGKPDLWSLPINHWSGMENSLAGERPTGSWLKPFDFDYLKHKIPPNPKDPLITQQLLMLKVAGQAIEDAGLKKGGNVAVMIGMEADLGLHRFRGRIELAVKLPQAFERAGLSLSNSEKKSLVTLAKDALHNPVGVNQFTSFIGNIMACRISSLFDFTGPAFTLSSASSSSYKGLELAQLMLSTGQVDAVVLGAIDLFGSAEEGLLQLKANPRLFHGGEGFYWSRGVEGTFPGEGAGAIVLQTKEAAIKQHTPTYAHIEAIERFGPTSRSGALQKLYKKMGTPGFVEVSAKGEPKLAQIEAKGLSRELGKESTALGSVSSVFGRLEASLGIAAVIKAALALQLKQLPGTDGWQGPKAELGLKEPLWVPVSTQPWLHFSGGPRIAAVNHLAQGGEDYHILMSASLEPGLVRPLERHQIAPKPVFFAGGNAQEVLDQLAVFKPNSNIESTSRASLKNQNQGTSRLVILASSLAHLQGEISLAQKALSNDPGIKQWQSPAGSCYSSENLAAQQLAFVYPGGFTSHVGMSRSLFRLFPELMEMPVTYAGDPATLFRDQQVYPRSLEPLSSAALKEKQGQLVGDAIGMFETGINASILQTMALQKLCGVKPDLVFGYSMGEVTMGFAQGLWAKTDKLSHDLHHKPVFQTQLAGPMERVRKAWGLKKSQPVDWVTYSVRADGTAVKQAVETTERVYLMIINSANDLVVGGEKQVLEALIEDHHWSAKLLPVSDAVHADFVQAEYKALYELHHGPIDHQPEIEFYTSFGYRKTEVTADQLAANIAGMYAKTVDFPQLVETLYSAGARVFVDLGPQPSCSRWVSEILEGRPYLSISLETMGGDGVLSWFKGLAKLAAQGVYVDWSVFYPPEKAAVKGLNQQVTPGGVPFDLSVIDQGRQLLGRSASPAQNIFPELPKEVGELVPEKLDEVALSSSSLYAASKKEQGAQFEAQSSGLSTGPQVAVEGFEPGALLAKFKAHHDLYQTQKQLSQNHLAFLESRHQGLRLMRAGLGAMGSGSSLQVHLKPGQQQSRGMLTSRPSYSEKIVEQTPTLAALLAQHPTAYLDSGRRKETEPAIIWDETDLLEFAQGKVEPVFGKDYSPIDTYGPRVRLPLAPYLLVNRVVELEATPMQQGPSKMVTEYDVPHGAWYAVDGQIPWAIAVEAGQCDLLLISYLGIDLHCKGEYLYRLLDCTLTFKGEMPKEGQTMRYEIYIDSFAKHGNNILFFFHYDCFVEGELVHTMTGGCAGFFNQADLDQGKGVLLSEKEKADRAKITPRQFTPLIHCQQTQFNRFQLIQLCRGEIAGCFGPEFDQGADNRGLRFSTEEFLMLDQITAVDTKGGVWGLGEVKAQKSLMSDHWYFDCHFKDDPCLAGSLMAEGCVQLLEFYLLYIGFQTKTKNARFAPIKELENKVRCRGQVLPGDLLLEYRMEVTDIGLHPRPYAKANVDIILEGKVIVDFIDVGIELVEKDEPQPRVVAPRAVKFDEQAVWEFALGSLENCFGAAYHLFEGRPSQRNPNSELQLISRVPIFEGTPGQFKGVSYLESEYDVPQDVWFLAANPGQVTPYAVIMEIALQPCGFLGAAMHSPLLFPEQQMCFRNLDAQAELLFDPPLSGERVTCKVWLDSTSATGATIIQQYRFELWVKGQQFYQGETTFGYFTPQALANQAGMDSGQKKALWHQEHQADLKATNLSQSPALFQGSARLGQGPLNFLDQVSVSPKGGKAGLGYIFGEKQIDPKDWFYACHFYQDPVMPGSLGVEAILQGIKTFALTEQLTSGFIRPYFTHSLGTVSWKYRGQIIPANKEMQTEIHLTSVEQVDSIVTIIADANLYKDGLRIYEVKGLSLSIREEQC